MPFEAEQILQIPIVNLNRHDEFTWPKTKDGAYTVKSGYQAIHDWKDDNNPNHTSSNNTPNPVWQKLWKLKIPPKYTTLIWRILQNALPVANNLRKRGINCYPLCPRCQETTENQDHVFSKCVWAQQIWFASPLPLKLDLQNNTFNTWLEESIVNSSSQNINLICALCYHIWKARNLLIFQNKDIPVMEIIQQAAENLMEFQQHQQNHISEQRIIQNHSHKTDARCPPPQNCLKLNVDAHCLGDGHWDLGLLLRSEDGRVVGART
jgi:hypothetical protein